MHRITRFILLSQFSILLILNSCNLGGAGNGSDLTVSKPIPENSLKALQATEFPFSIETDGKYSVSLDIGYYQENVYTEDPKETRITELPVYLQIDNDFGGNERKLLEQKELNFTLKDDLGWRGTLDENGHDREIHEIAFAGIGLAPGNYVLKIFANSYGDFNISGILNIRANFDKLK